VKFAAACGSTAGTLVTREAARMHGPMATIASTIHHAAWRVAAVMRGVNRTMIPIATAATSASQALFKIAASAAPDAWFMNSNAAVIFHPPQSVSGSVSVPFR
jgi:hypothetical protein